MKKTGIEFFEDCIDNNEKEIKTKRCPKCDTVKPLSDFHKHKYSNKGVQYHCKICRSVKGVAYSSAASKLMREYGFTRPDLGEPCKICKRTDQPLVFDHCHITKMFRGWLCKGCNSTLGILGDNKDSMKKFLKPFFDYVEEAERM